MSGNTLVQLVIMGSLYNCGIVDAATGVYKLADHVFIMTCVAAVLVKVKAREI